MVFANEESPVYMMGGFDLMAAMLENQPKVQAAFKSGGGVAWGDQAGCMFCAVARFFRPGYHNNLVAYWLPALDGVVAKLEPAPRSPMSAAGTAGRPCSWQRHSRSRSSSATISMPGSIADAPAHAGNHGVSANTRFEVGLAKDYPGRDFDLVTCFDCLHDMGDPAGAAAHIRQSLKPDGTWMIVEPMAGDALRAQPQSGRAPVLRGLDDDLHADVAVAGGRHGARRASGRGEVARGPRRAAASRASAGRPRRLST